MTPQMKITFPRTVSRIVTKHVLCQWTHWKAHLSFCTTRCDHWVQNTWPMEHTAGLRWPRGAGGGTQPKQTYLSGLCASCTALRHLHASFLTAWKVFQTQNGWCCDAFQSQSFDHRLLSLQRKVWRMSPGYMHILDPGLSGWPVKQWQTKFC